MNEIYWITALGNLSCAVKIILVLSIIILAVLILLYIFAWSDDEEDICKSLKKLIKYFIPIFIISLLLSIFVPSKKDMLLIYEVGGTVDYIKQNDKAKQLPDKCINALDACVDSLGNIDDLKHSNSIDF